MQELIVVRGPPGSGKSTFAKRLAEMYNYRRENDPGGPQSDWHRHYETDMFFEINGEYKFDPKILGIMHQACQTAVKKKLSEGHSVIISNTFSRIWEMQPYLDMAKEFGARVTVIECQGDYGNTHNVPQESIDKMKARWEKYP